MIFPALVEVPTSAGLAYVKPDEVVVIQASGAESVIHLSSGHRVTVQLASEDLSKRLWRFANKLNDGAFFNERHIQAIEPHGSGSLITLTSGLSFDALLPPSAWPEAIRMINETRNTTVGQL